MRADNHYVGILQRNASRINELHKRVHELAHNRETVYGRKEWQDAAREFRAAHETLSFPGGFENAIAALRQNDAETIEIALTFLEVQPYFFRSQYMRMKLVRLLKRSDLNDEQKMRFSKLPQRSR